MSSTFTTNKYLEEPALGDYNGTWSTPVNANFSAIDNALGGRSTINVVGASGTVALSTAQYQPPIIHFSGALTANVTYQLPASIGGFWYLYNGCSGAYSVTFASIGGGVSVVLPQGYSTNVWCDGVSVLQGNTTPPPAAGSNQQVQYNNGGLLAGASNLTWTGAALGVGTAAPAAALEVVGNVRASQNYPSLEVNSTSSSGYNGSIHYLSKAVQKWSVGVDFNNAGVQNYFIYDVVAGNIRFTIDPNGNVAMYANVTAPTFIGALSGNATTATNATNATNANYATSAGSSSTATSAGSASTATTQASTDNSTNIATTAFAHSLVLGVDQTWQNMSGSRAFGTTYTNSGTKPICFTFQISSATSGSTLTTVVGGVTLSVANANLGSAYVNNWPIVVVPAGATYSVSISYGSIAYLSWSELR